VRSGTIIVHIVKVKGGSTMKNKPKIVDPETIASIRLKNIIDVGLTASAMIRLFEQDTKEKKLRGPILKTILKIFEAKSEAEFKRIHSAFCQRGTSEIALARKNKFASYGQIAKTLDVVLKVAIYYCHLPECEKSKELSEWLNAAVDTKMMAKLRKHYPMAIKPWPRTIEKVDRQNYDEIQRIVKKFILEEHQDSITPVQFDDYYWRELNR
jgi:hypothetical protein